MPCANVRKNCMTNKVPVSQQIMVEVAIALPERQEILTLTVARGCTATEAVELSGFRDKYREALGNTESLALGIFSRPLNGVELPLPVDYVLEEHDRVEIYRPLAKDPKQARRERAAKGKQGVGRKKGKE